MPTRKFKPLYVAPFAGGFAVMTDNGGNHYRVGPNPLPKRAAEIVQTIIQRLELNLSANSKTRFKHNAHLVSDQRLRNWLDNRME